MKVYWLSVARYIVFWVSPSAWVCVTDRDVYSTSEEGRGIGSSLTWALSHGGAASVHMSYFRTFSSDTWQHFFIAFAWISTSDSAWAIKQTLESLNHFNLNWKPLCHYLPDPKALLSMAAEIFEGKDGDCAFTMCTYDWRHASALNPKNRMFPGPWSQKEEVHVSVTVWLSAEWVGCGVDFPLQPTGAQRTI